MPTPRRRRTRARTPDVPEIPRSVVAYMTTGDVYVPANSLNLYRFRTAWRHASSTPRWLARTWWDYWPVWAAEHPGWANRLAERS